jgi:hypothetical protein
LLAGAASHFLARSRWSTLDSADAPRCPRRTLLAAPASDLRFRIVTPPPITLLPGALVDYSLSLWRVRLGWRTLISRWEPPMLFVDEQVRVPYQGWVHTHPVLGDGGRAHADQGRSAV